MLFACFGDFAVHVKQVTNGCCYVGGNGKLSSNLLLNTVHTGRQLAAAGAPEAVCVSA